MNPHRPETPPPGWVRWGDSSGQSSADYTRDTTNPHAGLGCYRIHHPAGTKGYTVSDYHVGYRIVTQVGKAYTITFWARSDVPMTSMFYWDCYYNIQPFVDATSAGRFPYEVTTEWQEYTFTVDEGRDFYQDEVRYMLASFKPVGNEYALQRTLWIDDVVVTERDSTEEPLIDDRTLVFDPLPHRLDPGGELVINVDADVQLGPATQEASGVSFHRITGYGRHPYDRTTQSYNLPAEIDEALRQMRLTMTRFYGVGVETIDTPWTLELTLDKLADLMNTYQIPKDWTVIELEPVSADFTFDASFWAQAAAYSVAQGYGFRYWEVANEPYTRKATAFPDEDVYINHLKDVSDAVKAVQPGAQIGIGIWPGQPNWGNYTLKAAQGYYDFVVGHFYSSSNPFSNSFETVTLSANYMRLDDILRLNALIEAYNPGDNIYQLDTEWGLYGTSSSMPEPQTYWRSSNIVGTMHRAVRMIYYAREGMVRGASGWEMFCRLHYPTFGFLNFMDAPDKRMMLYYLTYYFNRHCGQYALDISGTAPWYTPPGSSGPVDSGPVTPVLATLSADGSEMYFVIANGSWITSHPCTISVSNFAITSAEGTGLSQSSMDADPLVQNETDAVNPLPLSTTTDQITFSLPAHTIAFIKAVRDTTGPTGRYVFYNNSAFDGDDPGANAADDDALAPDKTALLPGGTATFANYTSYANGINGVMVDIENLPATPTVADFAFKVGNDNNPAGWATATAPTSITVRAGEGAGGSDRVTLIWADNAIQKQWLQVTVKATANTALASDDVFYFGNALGETGNSASDANVTPTDMIAVRNNTHTLAMSPAPIDDTCDFNRDRKVGPTDAIICRNNGMSSQTALKLISVP